MTRCSNAPVHGAFLNDIVENEIDRFRQDMAALRVLPPAHYAGIVESIVEVTSRIEQLEAGGSIYRVGGDLYHQVFTDPSFGRTTASIKRR